MSDAKISAAQLLALRPQFYLEGGYRDVRGEARPELTGLWALAAAAQLQAAQVSPAELEAGIAALAPVARQQAESPLAVPEKLALRAAIEPLPAQVRSFLEALLDGVRLRADLRPMLAHLGQVLSLLALKSAVPHR